jgi:hypothetical protein
MRVAVESWAAWAPGLESAPQWRDWARAPAPLAGDGAPKLEFLPAMQRRRCDAASRLVLEVAHACCPPERLARVRVVVASRHGPFATMVSLLDDLARGEPLSPTRFAHSVHNAPAGQLSIFARDPSPSTSLAACADSFAHGFLEALAFLERDPSSPVLLVYADEPAPAPLSELAPGGAPYACAFLLRVAGDGTGVELALASAAPGEGRSPRPDALEFLRFWLAGEPSLRLAHAPRAWTWTRHD